MPQIEFNRYYRYQDLTALLEAYAAEYPSLVQVESIGKSYEGRDIWLVTVTNRETGPASEKPAFWCDGNIHASEVSASTAVLRLLKTLVEGAASSAPTPEFPNSNLLDKRAFYLVPRLNPDGAEWALESPPRIIRSSTRPYPFDEEPVDGLTIEDVDGDGRVLGMRFPDPHGPWKKHPAEPRLMVAREPG
ncbi:MAG TPA: M14 family zinc carboxypeptidase, partial [Fimbriimonadaceae bacterium]|nr:M14 family zinc carboxypeptidase [Fimbriimonadaceae bacterium]